MSTYPTATEQLRIATRTRRWNSELERDLANAMAAKAMTRGNAIGHLVVRDTDVPLEARLRLWLPLEISADYGNDDMIRGLMLLRQCHFLSDTHDGTTWSAMLTPLFVPGIDGAFSAVDQEAA